MPNETLVNEDPYLVCLFTGLELQSAFAVQAGKKNAQPSTGANHHPLTSSQAVDVNLPH